MKLIILLFLFYTVSGAAKESCSNLFKVQSVALIKPDVKSLARYEDYVGAYNLVSAKVENFIARHNSVGGNKPYDISKNPIPEFLIVTEKLLRNLESSPDILERMGKNLSAIWFHSLLPHRNLNRAILKVIDSNNKEIDLAADWRLEDRGILSLIHMYLNQKNHTSDSLFNLGLSLGTNLSRGTSDNIISQNTAKNIATAYEVALTKLPAKDQQFLFSEYMWDVVQFQSKEWSFQRGKLISYFERLQSEKVVVKSMFLGQLTQHLGSQLDPQLTSHIIRAYSQVKTTSEGDREYHLKTVIELIHESKMSEAEKTELITEAELHIAKIINHD